MPLVTTLNGQKLVKVPSNKHKIKWDKPSCSIFQTTIKAFLRPYWEFKIGVCEEFKIPGCQLRCDFLCFGAKIAVEASGSQHFEYNKFFHNGSQANFLSSIKRDDKKRIWLEQYNGFQVIELIESDVPKLSPEYIFEKFGVDIK